MMLINLHQCCRIKQWKAQLFAISNRFLFIYFYFWWYTLMGNFTVSFNSAPATLFCSLISLLFFFLVPLSIRSSLEQGCFLFLLSPKPFSFGWSVKDSDNQRGEAGRPAGETAQEAGQIYWAASERRTIRQGRAMPHSAGRSGKDFSLCLILMSAFVCRCVGCAVRDNLWRMQLSS